MYTLGVLSPTDERDIREMQDCGVGLSDLASLFHVSVRQIRNVFKRNGWKPRQGRPRDSGPDVWECEDCGCLSDQMAYFMVEDKLWAKYGCGEGMLCMACFAERCGRKLRRKDLTDCLANGPIFDVLDAMDCGGGV